MFVYLKQRKVFDERFLSKIKNTILGIGHCGTRRSLYHRLSNNALTGNWDDRVYMGTKGASLQSGKFISDVYFFFYFQIYLIFLPLAMLDRVV